MKPGHEQLRDWMERRGFNQRETAAHFGWDETFITKLLATNDQQRKPGLANALRIERETGIPVEAWVSTEDDSLVRTPAAPGRKRQ